MRSRVASRPARLLFFTALALSLVACHQLTNPIDPNSTTFTGDTVFRDPPGSARVLPEVVRWQSAAEHGPGLFYYLDIPDAEYGDADFFVEPRRPASLNVIAVVTFSDTITESMMEDAVIVASVRTNAGDSLDLPNWEVIEERRQLAITYQTSAVPTDDNYATVRVRIVDPNGEIVSERSFGILPGDVNGDGVVTDPEDYAAGPLLYDGFLVSDNAALIRADLDADGAIDASADESPIAAYDGFGLPGSPNRFDGTNPNTTTSVVYLGNGNDSGNAPVDSSAYVPGDNALPLVNGNLTMGLSGFVFSGWNTAADGSGTSYAAGDSPVLGAIDLVLYAQWAPSAGFTVNYDANGSTGAPFDGASPYAGGSTVTVLGPGGMTYAGNTFAGWNTAADGSGVDYNGSGTDTFTITANVTLYAQWQAGVTYDANGGSGAPTDGTTYLSGYDTVTVAAPGGMSRAGFTFTGWNTQADGLGISYDGSGTDSFTIARDTTLFAQWAAVPMFTVTYDANGSTGAPIDGASYATGSTVTVLGPGGMTYAGNTFAGWNTAAGGGGVDFDGSGTDTFTITANVTLYAQWQAGVTYDANGGSGAPTDGTTYLSGYDTVTVAAPGGMSRAGFTFTGWNTQADGLGISYDGSGTDSFTIARDTTLFAQWIELFDVTYNANGGSGAPGPQTNIQDGDNVTVAAIGGMTRPGFTFVAWNTAIGGTGTSFDPGDPFTVTQDETLYAIWDLNVEIYVIDGFGAGVAKLVRFDDMTGANTAEYDGTAGGGTQFVEPEGIAVNDTTGQIYVSDTTNNVVYQIDDMTGANQIEFGGPVDASVLTSPTDLYVNPGSGVITVADAGRVVQIDDITGTNGASFSDLSFITAQGITRDALGRILIIDWNSDTLTRIDDIGGSGLTQYDGGALPFQNSRSVAVDSADRIYVVDRINLVVYRFDDITGANQVTYDGGALPFVNPLSIFVGPEDRIYVGDTGRQVVYRFDDMTGANQVVYNGNAGTPFDSPQDIYVRIRP